MYLQAIEGLRHQDNCAWKCDECNQGWTTKYVAAKKNFQQNNGRHVCRECFLTNHNPMRNRDQHQGQLSPAQQKERIDAVCTLCGTPQNVSRLAYRKNVQLNRTYICKSCSQRGKTLSDTTRDKISQALMGRTLTDEHRQHISEGVTDSQIQTLQENAWYNTGKQPPRLGMTTPPEIALRQRQSNTGKVRTQEQRERYSEARKAHLEANPMTEETKQKISSAMAELIRSGQFDNRNSFRHERYETSAKCPQATVNLKSSWESTVARWLDASPAVARWWYESESLPYETDGLTRTYVPDFRFEDESGATTVVEVKPSRLAERVEENVDKIRAAEAWCRERGWEFQLWTERDIRRLIEELAEN